MSPYTWGTQLGGGTNSCTECHGTDAATLTTQAHPKHNASGCASGNCHTAATANTHTNGSVTFGGAYTFTYTAASTVVATNGGSFSSCSTWNPATGCHLGAATPVWNGQLAAGCTGCHGYPPSSGTNHLDANRTGYANNDTTFMGAHAQCAICHGVAGDNVAYGTPPTGFGTPIDKIGGRRCL